MTFIWMIRNLEGHLEEAGVVSINYSLSFFLGGVGFSELASFN